MSVERIGSHWIHPERVTYGSPTFSTELLYSEDATPGFDFAGLLNRVYKADEKDVDVYLRYDFKPGQTLPAPSDTNGLARYLYNGQKVISHPLIRKRVKWVGGGNETNVPWESAGSGEHLTPTHVARVIYGYGTPENDTGNLYQFLKTVNPDIQIFLPAVGPFNPYLGGNMWYTPPRDRTELAPWELYQYELAHHAYWDNNGNPNPHVPFEEVKFTMHTYSRVGSDGTANGGIFEPWSNHTGPFGAYWGTQWLDDAFYAIGEANKGLVGVPAAPPFVVTEWNTFLDGVAPIQNYPKGLLPQVVRYINFKPNCIGIASFVDQNYGGGWRDTSMTGYLETHAPRLYDWDQDHNNLLRNGLGNG